ncbi:MAG: hypothetical protein ACRCWO_12000 [Bosea sp. (in: a-proteobacteria)]
MSKEPVGQDPKQKDPVFDAIMGHNRVIIIIGGLLGIATALAASKGLIRPDSAIPAFGWIVFGLLVSELAYGWLKNAAPAQLISMPGRILALIAGVGVDIIAKAAFGVG